MNSPTIQQIFRKYGKAYFTAFGSKMPDFHKKAMRKIMNCRTGSFGMAEYHCNPCDSAHLMPRSCGNRNCPACQGAKGFQWSAKQIDKRLPGNHFMITFTVPKELRRFLRSNQHTGYNALFNASSSTIKTFAEDDKITHGGKYTGFWGVLHTWGQQLQCHPHIHYIVPGGALSQDGRSWCRSELLFFAPVFAMSKVVRGKFRELMRKEGVYDQIPASVWQTMWNVNIQAVGNGIKSIRYLARYVFKVAISNHRILKVENDMVTFSYKKQHSNRRRKMVLPVFEFMRRFLQHVLPRGLVKVRHYGFCHHACKIDNEQLKKLVDIAYFFEPEEIAEEESICSPPPLKCPHCGAVLTYMGSRIPMGNGSSRFFPEKQEINKTG